MTDPRHRRHVTRRTTVIGAVLAVCLGTGLAIAGAAGDGAIRPLLAGVLLIAVAAGVLAIDEARTVEARMSAELSRERARRTRDLAEAHDRISGLLDRVDGLETELGAVRSQVFSASRTTVIIAPDRKGPRVLELPDLLPAAEADGIDEAQLVIDLTDTGTITSPTTEAIDESVELVDDSFPTVEVVGEFSLEGLTLFRRPAGMPERFPSIDGAAIEAPDDNAAEQAAAELAHRVVDLRTHTRHTA